MVDRKLEDLNQEQKQALRWYTAKFGKAGKKEMQHQLEYIEDLNALCDAHLEAKMHRQIYKRAEATLKRIFTPEQWERRERLHAELEEERRQRRQSKDGKARD